MSIKPGDENINCLYKYRELAGDDPDGLNTNTRKLLELGQIYLSKPSKFNDPFDSLVDYSTDATEDEIRAYFHRLKFPISHTETVISKIRSGELKQSEFSKDGINGYAELLNIFCLTKIPTNSLMWSHYAKDHSGICIGFKVHFQGNSLNILVDNGQVGEVIPGYPSNLVPLVYVEYSDDRPTPYNIFKGNRDDLSPFFLRKSTRWQYEEELRMIIFDRLLYQNPITIPKIEITEITFGLKTKSALIDKVRSIISNYPNNGSHVNFYQCQLNPGSYDINRVLI